MACLDVLLIFCGILAAVMPAQGQTAQMFEWGFSGAQSESASLPSCRIFPIRADALTEPGVPPFYMMAFAVGGSPITSFIGTNESNLAWSVLHPVGTQLVLGVVDSKGNSGGIDAPLYNVTAGSNTQCNANPTVEPPFTITANVTDVLNTCEPWGLTIQGGTPPYNLTIAVMDSADVTNVTLGPKNTYTYINRVNAGAQIIASASDSNGLWATGSPFVRTQGSSNLDCTASDGTEASHSISAAEIGAIVAASVCALLVLSGIATLVILRRRRMQRPQRVEMGIDPFCEAMSTGDSQKSGDLAPIPPVGFPFPSSPEAGTGLTSMIENPSPLAVSVVASPVVRELPPPYPNLLLHEYTS
ncbi:hypothetical protein DFH07DRAFT_817168 [Mycena maculata]|uniref:Uncharacterized protein n=1 Tax=Mycena maculata TaxID=230809 RepID=A0AAD7J8Y0_9AGAR|nr:hypothetical protein DFH07DRAFT_817168 [Mycena maculata]